MTMNCDRAHQLLNPYVDGELGRWKSGGLLRHLGRCPSCARQDTAIRRSLMLVHNLPSIEPSAEFMARLNARLTEIGPTPRYASRSSLFFTMPAMGTFAAVAAGIGVVAVLSMRFTHYAAPTQIASAPIAAPFDSLPDLTFANISAPEITPLANAAYVAAVPTGIPIWPAVLMAGETPVRFASMELQQPDGR